MASQSYRGILKGQNLVVLDQPAPLPDGTPVEVIPVHLEAGSPKALLAAMEAEPHLDQEDIRELEEAIAEGRRAPAILDPFADHDQGPGRR